MRIKVLKFRGFLKAIHCGTVAKQPPVREAQRLPLNFIEFDFPDENRWRGH
jgi:hypothetical protein